MCRSLVCGEGGRNVVYVHILVYICIYKVYQYCLLCDRVML